MRYRPTDRPHSRVLSLVHATKNACQAHFIAGIDLVAHPLISVSAPSILLCNSFTPSVSVGTGTDKGNYEKQLLETFVIVKNLLQTQNN